MCLHFYLVLFEQVGYSMFLVQYRKVFSDQYNFFERVDLAFVLLYVYCVLRRHLIKKFKDVNANALFNSFFGGAANLFLRIHSYIYIYIYIFNSLTLKIQGCYLWVFYCYSSPTNLVLFCSLVLMNILISD